MATTYPTTIDTLSNPVSTDQVANANPALRHATQHANANDAIEALEAKVGTNGSAVTTSHDYKLGEVITTDKAVGKTATQTLTNKTLTSPTITNKTSTGTDSGTETLTNKSLTSPIITTPTISGTGFTNANHIHEGATTGGQLNATNVFSAGTVPTARLASGTANTTTYLRGDQTWASVTAIGKFGGTGVDSALTLTSGPTNIDLAGAAYFEKNYTSISITGTGQLTFTNPHANGTIIKLRSQGNVTLTSSATPNIEASNLGGNLTNSASASGSCVVTPTAYGYFGTGGPGSSAPAATSVSGQNGSNIGGYYWTHYVNSSSAVTTSIQLAIALPPINQVDPIYPGGGGSSGYDQPSGGFPVSGGRGGGALDIECNGSLNFTSTIWAKGQTGATNGSTVGGHGAGGTVRILYTGLTSASGTISVTSSGNAGQSLVALNTSKI